MKPQEEKNVQQTNDREAQAKPVKRVLRATDLRHMPGIAVQTDLKAGQWSWDIYK
jgi:hypothetical protein